MGNQYMVGYCDLIWRCLFASLLFAFLFYPISIQAVSVNDLQPEEYQTVVSGTVSDDTTGETLPGVNIIVQGTNIGTSTDIDGNFELSVPSLQETLIISFVGFETLQLEIDGRTELEITLQQLAISGDELVVIGYGTATRRELTGSISSVRAEDFNQGSVTDPMQLLQGKVAGLSIVRPNGGDPTSGFEIRLRGSSSLSASQEPLIVIDGIPGGDLNSINPENIESFDILKDGSAAAIYGTRGTNGVILVTTKRGVPGDVQVDYSGRFSTQAESNRINVLSAGQYREMRDRLSATHPEVANSMTDYGHSTDWFDEVTQTPYSHIHSLALSGGMENTSYRASIYYSDQRGILLTSGSEEFRANLNLHQASLNDRLNLDLRLGISERDQTPVNYDAMRQVITRNPTEPVYNEDGSLFEHLGAWQYDNPVGQLIERDNDNTSANYFGNLGINLSLTNNLRVSALAGLESNNWLNGSYQPSYSFPQESSGTFGSASRSSGRNYTQTLETTVEFRENINRHAVSLLGGYSYQDFTSEGFNASNTNFITDGFSYNNLGSGTFLDEGRAGMGSFKNESKLASFFSRGTYNYDLTYFLTASVRYEGSSKFGMENRWGLFPAVSVAWDLANENFAEFIGNNFDLFKFRAGFGVTGNEGIDPYIPLLRFGQSGNFLYEGEFVPGFQPVSNPNPNLRWETKHELNLGLDWAYMNGRIGGAIDYYIRDTKDLLHSYDVPVPPNLYGTTFANVGSMRNTGIEFSLNTIPVQTGSLSWSVDFNIEYRKNELLELSNEDYQLEFRNVGGIGSPGIEAWSHRYEPGRPVGSIHGLVFEGITENGEWIFADLDNDGEITPADRTYIGNGVPDVFAGLSSTLNYRRWDFSVSMRGMFGHQIINHRRVWYDNPRFLPNNILVSAMDTELWDDPEFSSYQVEDGDFVKIDNITVGYTIPVERFGLRSGRLFMNVNNPIVITGYTGLDPEVSIGGLTPGLDDRQAYPVTRTFTLGLNLSF